MRINKSRYRDVYGSNASRSCPVRAIPGSFTPGDAGVTDCGTAPVVEAAGKGGSEPGISKGISLEALEGLSLALLWAVVVVEDQHSMGKTCCALWEGAGAPAWMWQGWVHWLWGFNLQGLRSCGDMGTW